MTGLWITEAIPIYVTSLIPMVLGPLLQLSYPSKISPAYSKDTNMLTLGGLLMACAMENNNVHRRIAISILRLVGSDPKINVLAEETQNTIQESANNSHLQLRDAEQGTVITTRHPVSSKRLKEVFRMNAGLSLCIAYASSVGGIATTIGTPTNTFLYGSVIQYVYFYNSLS
ncbi:unnamed protein product [Trichobilharzia szidati]|nr:unnamed protein product [Trichobilharzia szidati]